MAINSYARYAAVSISPAVTKMVDKIKSLPNVAFGQEPHTFFINDSEYPIGLAHEGRYIDEVPDITYRNYIIKAKEEFFKLAKEGLTMEEIIKRLKPGGVKIKMASIIDHLERVANTLESKGFIQEAFELDKISNEVEAKIKSVYDEMKTPEPPIVKGEIQKMKTPETAERLVQNEKAFSKLMKVMGVSDHTWATLDPASKKNIKEFMTEHNSFTYNLIYFFEKFSDIKNMRLPEEDKEEKIKEAEGAAKKLFSSYPSILKDILNHINKVRSGEKVEPYKGFSNIYMREMFKVNPTYSAPKLASILDNIANFLEAKGSIKEAHDLDVVSNTLELMAATEPDSFVADNSVKENKDLAKSYEPKILKYVKDNPGCSMDELYTKLSLDDIPMYIAIHNLVKSNEIIGESPYGTKKRNHSEYIYTVK